MTTPNTTTAPAAATTRSLQIDGMTGDACIQRVTSTLKSVQGVTTKSVELGKAVIACESPAMFTAATGALRSAGYTSRETTDSSAKNGCSTAGAKPADAQTASASRDMTSEGAGGAIGGPNPGKPEEKRTDAPVVTKTTPLVAPVGTH